MQQRLLLLVLLACSACVSGPQLRVHVSDPAKGGMDWADQRVTPNTGFTAYIDTNNFVCFTPDDMQQLINYCKAAKP